MRHYKLLLVALAFLPACATDERDINISQSGATEKIDALDEQQNRLRQQTPKMSASTFPILLLRLNTPPSIV